MVSVETPSERARALNQQCEEQKFTLKYGQCVGLGAMLKAKLVAVSKEMTQKAVD